MSDERDNASIDILRRRLLKSGAFLGSSVGLGVRSTDLSSAAASGGGFDTDFEYTDSPANHGWDVYQGSFNVDGDVLSPSGWRVSRMRREQPNAAGTFEFQGVRNDERYYGLKINFISTTPNFDDTRGYRLRVVQKRFGMVELNRLNGDGTKDNLLTLTEDHGGEPFDVRIERDPKTWEFTCYYNGEEVGTVQEDDPITDSRYWVQKHGGNRQSIDGLASGPASSDDPAGDFASLADEKRGLAGRITATSPSIDEKARVEATLAALRDGMDDETVSSANATEAVERMIDGEQVTETLLEGLSPEVTEEFDTAGRIVDLGIDAVIELLLTATAFGRVGRWVGWGKLGKAMGKARSLLSRAVSKVVDTVTSGLSKVSNRIRGRADDVSTYLENLIKEGGITEGAELATKKAAELSGWRDSTANTLISLFEQNALFTDVNDKLTDLDETLDPETGGPVLSGTLDGAKQASERGVSDVEETLHEADDRLDGFGEALEFVRILGLIAMVLVASVWGSIAGAALSLVYAIFSVGTALIGAADGIDLVGSAVAEHNEGIDGVIAGQPEV